jgi:prolyl-tRNA editing enzyme YbaK/EbsC (Cys-tRNA(Pro) deacylase)
VRDPIEQAVIDALDQTGVPYELLDCDPDFADTAAFCRRYGVRPEESANTIVVVGKTEPRRYCACVVTATTRLDVNGTVRRLLDAKKASFAGADETRELTGMLIGGVTAVALPEGMPLYVDTAVMEQESVVIGGGSRGLKVRVSPELFRKLANATVVDGLARPAPAPT